MLGALAIVERIGNPRQGVGISLKLRSWAARSCATNNSSRAQSPRPFCPTIRRKARARFSAFTVELYLRRLVHVAHWLREHPRRLPLDKLTRRVVSNLLNDFLEGRCFETVISYRKVLLDWLRF